MYVLILTMAVKVANAGVGGVSMHEFESGASCINAGEKWVQQISSIGRIERSELRYLCIKK